MRAPGANRTRLCSSRRLRPVRHRVDPDIAGERLRCSFDGRWLGSYVHVNLLVRDGCSCVQLHGQMCTFGAGAAMMTTSLYEHSKGWVAPMADEQDYERRISRIREIVDHPIVDADAHLVEPFPFILEELREILGPNAEADFARSRYHTLYSSTTAWPPMSDDQRRREWAVAPVWWGTPVNATDRAAAYVPEAFYRRTEQLGIDHGAVYPSWLGMTRIPEAELRAACCRAADVISLPRATIGIA